MSSRQIPPWLQEHIARLQRSQQDLQSITTQKQHLEMEMAETEKALEELGKITDDGTVFKQAGTILIKSTKRQLIDELEEKRMLANTRSTVLGKQETRLKESLKEQETKITQMMQSNSANPSSPPPSQAPPEDNPRR